MAPAPVPEMFARDAATGVSPLVIIGGIFGLLAAALAAYFGYRRFFIAAKPRGDKLKEDETTPRI